ncbi:MAG: hypothetical protein P4L41_11010 [Flavipsychrobacter sp.]|nr:hypothetical protein [Flavipsychrobacter sp.]
MKQYHLYLLIIAFLALPNNCFADKYEGYIIKLNGDTVRVTIVRKGLGPTLTRSAPPKQFFGQEGVAVVDATGKGAYEPGELKGYGYTAAQTNFFFESVAVKGKVDGGLPAPGKYFMQKIEAGAISLYKFDLTNARCSTPVGSSFNLFAVKKKGDDNVIWIKSACDKHPDYEGLSGYLGSDHKVLQRLDSNYRLAELLLSIHQYNVGDNSAKKIIPQQLYCDSCPARVLQITKQGTDFAERQVMNTYAESGFYLYPGEIYTLHFSDGKALYNSLLVSVDKEKIRVTTTFNKSVAQKENITYDTLTYPISSLTQIDYVVDAILGLKKKINIEKYNVITKEVVGGPAEKIIDYRNGEIHELYWLFMGPRTALVFEMNGQITFAQG